MGVDQAWHEDLFFAIHHVIGLIIIQDFRFRANGQNDVTLNGDRTGIVNMIFFVHGQDGSIFKYEICFFHISPVS